MKWSDRQTAATCIPGWRGLRVTVIKLKCRHPGRPGDCQTLIVIITTKKKILLPFSLFAPRLLSCHLASHLDSFLALLLSPCWPMIPFVPVGLYLSTHISVATCDWLPGAGGFELWPDWLTCENNDDDDDDVFDVVGFDTIEGSFFISVFGTLDFVSSLGFSSWAFFSCLAAVVWN